MTYFYKTFKKYTHFSLETTTKLMDGPTDYPSTQSIQLKCRVDRIGDLVSDMYFSFQLPAIFSKYRPTTTTTTKQQEFQWVRTIGAAAIQSVYITVGPNRIQEFTGEYLMAKALIDYPKDKYEKWQQLVGDIPEIYDPANGLYGGSVANGAIYPTVYPDPRVAVGVATSQPSIPSYTIYVPLPFWFTDEGQALPLIGLQYYTVDVTINLTPSQQLYTTLDAATGVRMAPGYTVVNEPESMQNNMPEFTSSSDTTTQIRNFFVDVGATPPPLNLWTMSPTLHVTYVFLPEAERTIFASTPLSYVIRQVTQVSFPEIIGNQLLNLDIHNPITRLIFVPRRSDSLLYRNNLQNFTNWWNWPSRPKIPTEAPLDNQFIEMVSATGLLVPFGQPDIIQALRILSDGNEIQEMKPTSFYTDITPFKYLAGGAKRRLPVYAFELHSPTIQPSGSLNSSRISRFQVDLQVYPLPPDSTYIYSMNIYVENLNFFLVESGMGDVKYAL
jgi:hypothetical protein